MYSIQKQKGMTAIGWILIFLLIAMTALFILKLVPIYIDGYSVKQTVEALKNEHNIGSKTPLEIKRMIMKRLDINMVTAVTSDDIYIDRGKGNMTIEVEYEVREKLVGNLDIVVVFNPSVQVLSN